jgi:hypothetical protein
VILPLLVPLLATLTADQGVIDGVVLNATRAGKPAAGVEVVLRVPISGQFVVAAQTTAAADGSFRFERLPTDAPGPFLPGANLDDIHFPGPRVRLTATEPRAHVTLSVFASTSGPNPLVVERHEIEVQAQPGSLRVRETMRISNPSATCYVGSPRHEGGGPVTLELGIPADFERITFDKEAFGREFHLINDKLVTGIPWPPGQRELAFSYVIPSQQGNRTWRRRIDLPSQRVRLTARGADARKIVSNLPTAAGQQAVEQVGGARFESDGTLLPAGSEIHLQLERLAVPLIVHARRGAVAVLLVLVATVGGVAFRPAGGLRKLVARPKRMG